MTITSSKITFEDFLQYDDGNDTLYELENGELIAMPVECEINRRIAVFLLIYLNRLGIPSYRLTQKTEVVVSGAKLSVRIPDLVVLSEEGATALQGASRSLILMDMPPPILVVEVVSPQQEKRDYRYKRSEYAARGIAEYWIVDPIQQCLTVLEWVEGFYEQQVYRGDDKLNSPILNQLIAAGLGVGDSFPEVPELTVAQVLRGQ